MAPHVAKSFQEGGHCADKGPEPAPRHLGRFDDKQIPRSPSFNENDVSDKPEAVRKRKKLEGVEFLDKTDKYQCRLETLLSVDDGVGEILDALKRTGELRDTYIFFVSDNGFIQGDHRIDGGKAVPYEGAITIPMLVRGPGVKANEVATELVSNVDYASTVLELAGAKPRIDQDGRSFVSSLSDPDSLEGRAVLIESEKQPDPFRGVRTSRYLYIEREKSGESEMYDLRNDPDELDSVQTSPIYQRARLSLRALLGRLRDCAGKECTSTPRLGLSAKWDRCGDRAEVSLTGPDARFAVGVEIRGSGKRYAYTDGDTLRVHVPSGEGVDLVVYAELSDGRETRLRTSLDECE